MPNLKRYYGSGMLNKFTLNCGYFISYKKTFGKNIKIAIFWDLFLKLPYLDMIFTEVFKTNHNSKFFIYFYLTLAKFGSFLSWMILHSHTSQNCKKTFNYGYFNNFFEYYKCICHYSIVDNCWSKISKIYHLFTCGT